jgi:hypothetical protein
MIFCIILAPIDNFAFFLLFSILFVQYSTVKHEPSFLNPVESTSTKIRLVPVITMNNEIILSSIALLILPVNFSNVVNEVYVIIVERILSNTFQQAIL